MIFDKFMGLIQKIKSFFLSLTLEKCNYCKKPFSEKERFINIIKNTPRDDYKEMIGLSNFCSNDCAEKEKHIDDINIFEEN